MEIFSSNPLRDFRFA